LFVATRGRNPVGDEHDHVVVRRVFGSHRTNVGDRPLEYGHRGRSQAVGIYAVDGCRKVGRGKGGKRHIGGFVGVALAGRAATATATATAPSARGEEGERRQESVGG